MGDFLILSVAICKYQRLSVICASIGSIPAEISEILCLDSHVRYVVISSVLSLLELVLYCRLFFFPWEKSVLFDRQIHYRKFFLAMEYVGIPAHLPLNQFQDEFLWTSFRQGCQPMCRSSSWHKSIVINPLFYHEAGCEMV